MSDPGPMVRFEQAKLDPALPHEVEQRLTDLDHPQTLREIAKARGFPGGLFESWFLREHAEAYARVKTVLADRRAHAALKAADDATPETVQVAALQAKTNLAVAGKWDRPGYGEQVKIERVQDASPDAALVVGMVELLKLAVQGRLPKPEKVINPVDEIQP